MRNATLVAFGALMALHGTAFSQTLKQVDCTAFEKMSDGSYYALKDTTIITDRDNTFTIHKTAVIADRVIDNGRLVRDMIRQSCPGVGGNNNEATLVPPELPHQNQAAIEPPPLPEPKFFYADAGKPSGPITLSDLKAKLADGTIRRDTLVWKTGTPNWVPARDVPELIIQPAKEGQPDIRSFFLGTWETEAPGPAGTEGPVKMVLTLGQDGNVQGNYTVHLAGSGGTLVIPVRGKWSAAALSEKKANLTFNLLVRNNNQENAVNETFALEIVDQDTVRDLAQGTVTKRVKA
jgi:hypothetical protein